MADPIALVNTITSVLPGIVALIRATHVAQNPGVPQPTSEDIVSAFETAVAASLARGELWLAGHPTQAGE